MILPFLDTVGHRNPFSRISVPTHLDPRIRVRTPIVAVHFATSIRPFKVYNNNKVAIQYKDFDSNKIEIPRIF